ncbi:MAG: ParB/RepB/Spo0J family partition protein [Gemmatimonadaceae bacterium]
MAPSPEKPRRLGRGLEALLASRPPASPVPAAGVAAGTVGGEQQQQEQATQSRSAGEAASELQRVRVAEVRPNPYQPRKEFSEEDLAELEASLRTSGLIQPITVRRSPSGRGYELIAGERRLRAAQRIGWEEIPALVKDIDDQMAATLALVENLQRSDLNPIEEAEGYQRIMQEFSLTQQQVADVVGKDRSTVANALRVLSLPAAVRRMLQEGQITSGHARALLGVGNEMRIVDVAREIVAHGLTVRDVEKRARDVTPQRRRESEAGKGERGSSAAGVGGGSRDPHARRIEDQLRRYLQTDVHLTVSAKERGEIRIMFYSNDDLERVLELVLGANGDAS